MQLPNTLDRPTVRPALEGVHRRGDGITYIAGEDYVEQGVADFLNRGETLAIDIESEGLGELAYRLKCVTVATQTTTLLLDPRVPAQYRLVQRVTANAASMAFHNSAFDVPILGVLGMITLDDVDRVFDTLIYARLAESDTFVSKSLHSCVERYLHAQEERRSPGQLFKIMGYTKHEGFKNVDVNTLSYQLNAMSDAVQDARLLPKIQAAALTRLVSGHPYSALGVKPGPDAVYLLHREQVLNRIFLKRSILGLNVDLDYADEFDIKNTVRIDSLARELEEAGVRPGHGASLVAKLDSEGILPENHPRTGKTRAPSATKSALKTLNHPLVSIHNTYKELVKTRDDYLAKVRSIAAIDGRIHPTVGILSASATGRMSIGDPPLQQFPDEARGVVVADPGTEFTSIDWGQIEPTVLMNIAHDYDALVDYDAGTHKLYDAIAKFSGADPKQAKTLLLGQMYGQGMEKLAFSLGVTRHRAEQIRDQIFNPIPKTRNFMRRIRKLGDQYGLIVTVSGRILSIPRNDEGGYAGYKAVNYLCQGSAYDVLAESLIAIKEAGLEHAIYLAMHDELLVKTEYATEIRRIMEVPPQRLIDWSGRVPVLRTDREDLGPRWRQC